MPGPAAHSLRDLWQRHVGLAATRTKVLKAAAAAGLAHDLKIEYEFHVHDHVIPR